MAQVQGRACSSLNVKLNFKGKMRHLPCPWYEGGIVRTVKGVTREKFTEKSLRVMCSELGFFGPLLFYQLKPNYGWEQLEHFDDLYLDTVIIPDAVIELHVENIDDVPQNISMDRSDDVPANANAIEEPPLKEAPAKAKKRRGMPLGAPLIVSAGEEIPTKRTRAKPLKFQGTPTPPKKKAVPTKANERVVPTKAKEKTANMKAPSKAAPSRTPFQAPRPQQIPTFTGSDGKRYMKINERQADYQRQEASDSLKALLEVKRNAALLKKKAAETKRKADASKKK